MGNELELMSNEVQREGNVREARESTPTTEASLHQIKNLSARQDKRAAGALATEGFKGLI